MINLLPQKKQKDLFVEYKRRRLFVLLASLILVAVMGLVFLVPSYIISTVRLSELQVEVSTSRDKDASEKSKAESSTVLKDTNAKLAALKPSLDSVAQMDIVNEILKARGESIRLKSFTMTTGTKDVQGRIVISGIAKNRESLTEFLRAMEASPTFTDVILPVSNFTKDRDIQFSMDLAGDF